MADIRKIKVKDLPKPGTAFSTDEHLMFVLGLEEEGYFIELFQTYNSITAHVANICPVQWKTQESDEWVTS